MSHGGHGGIGADSDESRRGNCADSAESRREHAGYQCLGCRQTWSTLFALGQHTGSPYLRGTRCATQNSAAELRNVPRADLATGRSQAIPIFRPGMHGIYVYVNIGLLMHIVTCYYVLLRIIDLPKYVCAQSGLSTYVFWFRSIIRSYT